MSETGIKRGDQIKGIIQLVLVVGFVGGSLLISKALQNEKKPTGTNKGEERTLFVETEIIQSGAFRIQFEATGTVDARSRVDIVPQVSGQVVRVHEAFYTGGRFEAGVVLFEIDRRDYDFEIQRLNADISRARTALDLEVAESKAALMEWRQFKGNEDAPDLVARRPQMAEARAALSAAQAQLSDAKLNLERTRFTLPFAGRVISGGIEKGQYVSAGQSYGSVFDSSGLEVSVSLPDQQLEWLLNSEDPQIEIIASQRGEEKIYEGVLKRGASSFDAQTRFARVNFGFAEVPRDLLPGVFVRVKILGPELNNVSVVPSNALQKDGHIFVVKDDNTLHAIDPQIAYQDGQEIALKNLEASARVVVSRVSGASEGSAVSFEDVEAGEGMGEAADERMQNLESPPDAPDDVMDMQTPAEGAVPHE